MGQGRNSRRNASLDNKKQRAAGRQDEPNLRLAPGRDFDYPQPGRGQTKGAFGRWGNITNANQQDTGMTAENAGQGAMPPAETDLGTQPGGLA